MSSTCAHFVLILMLVLVRATSSYKCYSCDSKVQDECGYKFNSSSLRTVDCEPPRTCKKILLPVIGGGREPIKRGCLNNDLCTSFSVCLECEHDLCNALQCYKCHSDENDICLDGEQIQKFGTVECASDTCLKVLLPSLGGRKRTERGCFNDKLCDEYSVCLTCDDDLCNSSTTFNSFCALLLTSISVVLYVFT
ncbi:hypothetical protein FQR65_LT01814 [Abscondita terminalis]|nr:hypothetical protein FQR65_LT01814 [Abscondita terminalis]